MYRAERSDETRFLEFKTEAPVPISDSTGINLQVQLSTYNFIRTCIAFHNCCNRNKPAHLVCGIAEKYRQDGTKYLEYQGVKPGSGSFRYIYYSLARMP
jgi:hypothetical protein